jgi:hypothetical protein
MGFFLHKKSMHTLPYLENAYLTLIQGIDMYIKAKIGQFKVDEAFSKLGNVRN